MNTEELLKHPTLTVDQVANILGISRLSAYKAVHSGELPSVRIGRRYLVPTAAVRKMLAIEP